MKITTISDLSGSADNLEIKKPISHLMIRSTVTALTDLEIDIDLRLIDSSNGKETIITSGISAEDLMKISAFNEGAFCARMGLIEIAPLGAINLSNSKFLRLKVEGSGFADGENVDIYGIENDNPIDDFVKYSRMFISAGQASQSFMSDNIETLMIKAISEVDEIRIHFDDGATATYSSYELPALQLINDDVSDTTGTDYPTYALLDLDDVKSFEIVKANAANSLEFFTTNVKF